MPGGAATGWVLGVSPLSIPTWVRELAGAVAGFIPARRQWLRYTAPGCAREGATLRQCLSTRLMSFHTKTMRAFLLTVTMTLAQSLCRGEGGHMLLFSTLPPRALTGYQAAALPRAMAGLGGQRAL